MYIVSIFGKIQYWTGHISHTLWFSAALCIFCDFAMNRINVTVTAMCNHNVDDIGCLHCRFSASFYNWEEFCDFLFAFLHSKSFLKGANLNSFPASGDFCPLLITFANSLDPDQAQQNVGPDLDPNWLTHWWYSCKVFLKKLFFK